jgi:hypothetical protein
VVGIGACSGALLSDFDKQHIDSLRNAFLMALLSRYVSEAESGAIMAGS